jgi:(4S)-4-hydroxy-5-phosphonooxypentane-2,3-dione isomerase
MLKPEQTEKFLKAIEHDALGSERDEPGCLRFNVLRDEKDPAHRAAPHHAVWRAAGDTLDGPVEATRCAPVLPAAQDYRGKV